MAKNHVNGYREPKIEVINELNEVIYTAVLSFKYDALKEYHEVIATLMEFTDGSKEYIAHYVNYEWRLFYTSRIDKDDLIKLVTIENAGIVARRFSYKIWLTPHIDLPDRKFRIFVLPEKREIDLHYHHRGLDSTPNKGYEISFVNAESILSINVVDPGIPETHYGGSFKIPFKGQLQTP